MDVGSGLQMYDDLISPMIDGGDENWSVHGARLFQEELDSISLWVVAIC